MCCIMRWCLFRLEKKETNLFKYKNYSNYSYCITMSNLSNDFDLHTFVLRYYVSLPSHCRMYKPFFERFSLFPNDYISKAFLKL